MSRRFRKTVFVCCGNGMSQTIEAATVEEAKIKFEQDNKITATDCHGPFTTKKTSAKVEYTNVVFSGESKNAIYNDWYVKALLTKEPHNCAYLLFDKRVDGKKMPKPQGSIIVKIDYLKDMNSK